MRVFSCFIDYCSSYAIYGIFLFRVIMVLLLDNGLILVHLMLIFFDTLGGCNYEYVLLV